MDAIKMHLRDKGKHGCISCGSKRQRPKARDHKSEVRCTFAGCALRHWQKRELSICGECERLAVTPYGECYNCDYQEVDANSQPEAEPNGSTTAQEQHDFTNDEQPPPPVDLPAFPPIPPHAAIPKAEHQDDMQQYDDVTQAVINRAAALLVNKMLNSHIPSVNSSSDYRPQAWRHHQ